MSLEIVTVGVVVLMGVPHHRASAACRGPSMTTARVKATSTILAGQVMAWQGANGDLFENGNAAA